MGFTVKINEKVVEINKSIIEERIKLDEGILYSNNNGDICLIPTNMMRYYRDFYLEKYDNQTYENCLISVLNNANYIKYVRYQSVEMCKFIITSASNLIDYIELELIEESVKQLNGNCCIKPDIFKHLSEETKKICFTRSLAKDINILSYIDNIDISNTGIISIQSMLPYKQLYLLNNDILEKRNFTNEEIKKLIIQLGVFIFDEQIIQKLDDESFNKLRDRLIMILKKYGLLFMTQDSINYYSNLFSLKSKNNKKLKRDIFIKMVAMILVIRPDKKLEKEFNSCKDLDYSELDGEYIRNINRLTMNSIYGANNECVGVNMTITYGCGNNFVGEITGDITTILPKPPAICSIDRVIRTPDGLSPATEISEPYVMSPVLRCPPQQHDSIISVGDMSIQGTEDALEYLESVRGSDFNENSDKLKINPVEYKIIEPEGVNCRRIIAFKNKDNEWRFNIGCQNNLTKEQFIARIKYCDSDDEFDIIDLNSTLSPYHHRKEYLKILENF